MSINLDRVSDAQIIADRLVGLPKEALLYIAGYAEGYRDSIPPKPHPGCRCWYTPAKKK